MKFGIAAFAVLALTCKASAQPVPAPELCPLDQTHTSLGIAVITSQKEAQGNATLVTCQYKKIRPDPAVSETSFQTYCPADQKLALPGYALNEASKFELKVISFVPTPGSGGIDFARITVIPSSMTLNLNVSVYSLCRS